MMAAMLNLPEIDRELEVLHNGTPDVPVLLGRILGSERSLGRLDELLASLGAAPSIERKAPSNRPTSLTLPGMSPTVAATAVAPAPEVADPALAAAQAGARALPPSDRPAPVAGAARPSNPFVRSSLPPRIVSPLSPPVPQGAPKTVTPWPPLSSGSTMPPKKRDTLVDAPFTAPPPPAPSESELDAETRALFGITDPPAAINEPASDTAVTAVNPEPPRTPSPLPEAPDEPLRGMRPARQTLKMHASSVPPEARQAASEASAPSPSPSTPPSPAERDRMRALLDRDLDPRDFPSSYPPPNPAPTPSAAPKTPPALPSQRDSSFEMVIEEDEEIIEIEDVELEEID